jgi:hypothetical protein
MTREVSLYRGLPDGWQYQNIDYRNAHADFVEYQRIAPILPYDPSLGRTRPRMPEIAPLFRADFEDFINYKAEETGESSFHLASTTGMSLQAGDYHSQPIPSTSGEGKSELQIDPLLLALSESLRGPSLDYDSPISRDNPLSDFLKAEGDDMTSSAPLSPSALSDPTSATGTPAVKLETLDSMKTFRDFLSIRDYSDSALDQSLDQENKDNSHLWRETNDGDESGDGSPTSVRSDISGLSLVATIGSTSPDSMTGTPMTTAPVTPVNEVPNGKGIGGLLAESNGKEIYVDKRSDLDAVIQAVSICDG